MTSHRPDSDPATAFLELEGAFREAAGTRCAGTREEWFTFGDRRVRITIAGQRLAATLLAPFLHLSLKNPPARAAADLSIELWSEAETGRERPVGYLRDFFRRSWPFGGGALAGSADDGFAGFQTPQTCAVLDRGAGRIIGWVSGHDRLSLYEIGKPLQPLIFSWCVPRGILPLHAGFVAREGAGVLIGGSGGAGKSTTSLACVQAGFAYLGDDYIGLPTPAAEAVTGCSFYNSTWLDPDHADRFPWIAAGEVHGNHPLDTKRLFCLANICPDRLLSRAGIRLLCLPRVTGATLTTAEPATPGEALLAFAPSSILQLPFIPAAAALNRITELVETRPAFRLDLGTDIDSIPRAVDRILDRIPDR